MSRGSWRALLAGGGVLAVLLAGCSDAAPEGAEPPVSSGGEPAPEQGGPGDATGGPTQQPPPDDVEVTTEAPQAIELPRGGTEIFPHYRLFGYSGLPGSPGMGRMGIGDLDERVVEMEERGEEYAGGRDLLPVLELIATVVHATPGSDGMFRTYIPESVIQDHLDAARRHQGILLLNIQPGRADFIDEVKHYEKWLVEPDVGVALDPRRAGAQVDGGAGDAGDALECVLDGRLAVRAGHAFDDELVHLRLLGFTPPQGGWHVVSIAERMSWKDVVEHANARFTT